MSAMRIGRPRSTRATSAAILTDANGSPDSAIVGGLRSGEGRPAGASRRRNWPGADRAAVTSMSPPSTGIPDLFTRDWAAYHGSRSRPSPGPSAGGRTRRAYDARVPYDEATRASTQAKFARIVAMPDASLDLALGALVIASDGRSDVDPDPSVAILDSLASRVRLRLDVGDSLDTTLERLHDVRYRETGFRGPTAAEFHDPRNSLLDVVLWRRVGLPISLAIVELEVAARLGVVLRGVGLPGHFIVGAPSGVLMDPAAGGVRLRPDDCQALIRRAVGDGVLYHSGMLRPASKREILTRVLRNLRSAHLAARDWPAALGAVDLLAVVEPLDPDHGRDRGLLLGRMGRFNEALAALSRYLEERPDAHDTDDVRQVMGIFARRRN